MPLLSSKHVIKKIVMLGDSGTGKTSLVRRYVIDQFDDKYVTTIGTKIMKKEIDFVHPSKTIYLTMILWDMLGQREYRKMRTMGIKDASGAMLVSDLTRQETISGLIEFWQPQIEPVVGKIPTIVIGNKCDLLTPDSKAVEDLTSFANMIQAKPYICSAKTGENVEAAFRALGELITREYMDPADASSNASHASYSSAVDDIVADFCEQFDEAAKGMEAIDALVGRAGMNINSPSKESALELIELMAESERDRFGREISKVNKMRRWKILEEVVMPK